VTDGSLQDRLRKLPPVDRLVDALSADAPRSLLVSATRTVLDEIRSIVRSGADAPAFEEIVSKVEAEVAAHRVARLKPVINATGVLIHTNLGRVPLGSVQLDAVKRIASGYSNLEYDLEEGRRGSRLDHAGSLLAELTGAEAGLVVNNNAAAVLLTLAGLCGGREVVISRGELVEIGGEFRIPDVMEIAGARLVEVGTTNRTRLADYERAISEDTAAVLKVHPSNYQMIGFTSSVAPTELARLAHERDLAFIHDLGSGLARATGEPSWTADEPDVRMAVAEGADVVTFSGDKLLGGPQAGLIAGRADAIEKLARHALVRALRVDKMTLAALEVTLELHLRDETDQLPLWDMATTSPETLDARARAMAERIGDAANTTRVDVVETTAVSGGGSLPGAGIPSRAVALVDDVRTPAELARRLRRCEPPVVARVEDGRLLLDLRCVAQGDDETLAGLVVSVLSA
jgi:L-seryl-tRNA(Ser) seleniumtransferase